MSASIHLYGSFPGDLASKKIDWQGDTIKVALLTSSYSPNVDTHAEWGDVSSNQASGTGYTAGGATLGGKSMSYNSGNNTRTFDGNDVEWTESTITARYAVIYDDTTSGKPLIGYVDFAAERASNEGLFRIAWNANGIFTVTV